MTAVHDVYRSAHRESDNGPPALFATGLSADARTYSAPLRPQPVKGGDTTLVVVPRMGASGRTATVEVGLYHRAADGTYTFLCPAGAQVATATPATDGTGFYPAEPLLFPLMGATHYDVRVVASSAGTVDVRAWTAGAVSAAAEA